MFTVLRNHFRATDRLFGRVKINVFLGKMRRNKISIRIMFRFTLDKVWHQGLLYKLREKLPDQIFLILNSYINDRYFQVKIENTLSQYYPVQAGVPQGSVLGPLYGRHPHYRRYLNRYLCRRYRDIIL